MAEKSRLPLFDGNNFSDWKFRLHLILEERDLLKFIERNVRELVENEPNAETERSLRKGDREAKSLLSQCISDNYLEYIKDKSSAFDMMKELTSHFEQKGVLSQTYCRKKLLTLKYDGSLPMEEFFLKFDTLARQLKDAGSKLEENELVSYLLLSLPTDFNGIVTALETVDDDKLTLTYV